MSMLSAQIDHLRELADALDGKYGYQGYEIAMRDAADTICELRGALQVASVDYRQLADENRKLRELVRDMMRYYFMPSAIDSKRRETELLERASELGVEEDNGELGVEVPDGD